MPSPERMAASTYSPPVFLEHAMNVTIARILGTLLCPIAILAGCSDGTAPMGIPAPSAPLSSLHPSSLAPVSFAPDSLRGLVSSPRRPLARRSGWFSAAAKRCKQKLFVSSYWLGYVSVYCAEKGRHNQAPIGQIAAGIDGPEGEATDANGNLYVANTGAGTVTEYAPDSTTVSFTYSADLSYPAGVAVDAEQNVYVTNLGSGSVTVFPQGTHAPSLSISGIPYPIDVALDANGNVYVTSFTSNFSNGEILEYAPRSTQGTDLGIVTETPGGIMLDKSAAIVTADQRLPGVLVFPRGKITPSQTFAQNMNDPVPVRFNHSERLVFVGDSIENDVEVYSYPAGSLIDTITDGIDGPEGLALDPAPPLSAKSW
jgi:sugar lactone lactonase YvrE